MKTLNSEVTWRTKDLWSTCSWISGLWALSDVCVCVCVRVGGMQAGVRMFLQVMWRYASKTGIPTLVHVSPPMLATNVVLFESLKNLLSTVERVLQPRVVWSLSSLLTDMRLTPDVTEGTSTSSQKQVTFDLSLPFYHCGKSGVHEACTQGNNGSVIKCSADNKSAKSNPLKSLII